MKREPKTLKVACFPDGRKVVICKKNGAYWWSRSEGSYPFSAAKQAVEELGGWIETIPNPNYRSPRLFG